MYYCVNKMNYRILVIFIIHILLCGSNTVQAMTRNQLRNYCRRQIDYYDCLNNKQKTINKNDIINQSIPGKPIRVKVIPYKKN